MADEIIVNANLVEHLPDSTAAAVELSGLTYTIDPILARFQFPAWAQNNDGATKRNYASLAATYGEGTSIPLGTVPIMDAQATPDEWRRVGSNAARYQFNRLADIKVTLPLFAPPLQPVKVFAPALVAMGAAEDRVNRLLLEGACDASPEPVRALLVIPPERLADRERLTELLAAIQSDGVAAYFIWTPGVSESRLLDEIEMLQGLIHIARTIAERGLAVGHLHGGYVASALSSVGVGAVAHSLGWVDRGEPAVQTGGGPPSCSTYVPGVRRTCRFELARDLARGLSASAFQTLYCECTLCVGFLEGGQNPLDLLLEEHAIPSGKGGSRMTPTSRALGFNTWHFLGARRLEMQAFAARPTVEVIAQDMERALSLGGRSEEQRLRRLASRLS